MQPQVKNLMVSVLLLLVSTITYAEQLQQKNGLTLAGAKKIIAAASSEARRLNAPGAAIAVVDEGGNTIALERFDNTFAAGATISIGKARTAALFKKPTKFFEDIIKNGRTAMTALPDSLFTPLQGGIPIVIDGQVVGAVGVSGAASAQQDEDLAIAGAKAIAAVGALPTVTGQVSYFDSRRVESAFAKGEPLLETEAYKVHASRREKPGLVEIHENETDVLYVLEGTATLVTGGKVSDYKTIASGEIRANSTEGGEVRKLAKGDVVVIPQGQPHWFKEVSNPFLYFVVKPISD